MILLPICTEPQDFVREEHVCYYAKAEGYDITLLEIVQAYYRHPNAPEDAIVPCFDVRFVKKLKRTDPEAAAVILLEASQDSVRYQRNLNIPSPQRDQSH